MVRKLFSRIVHGFPVWGYRARLDLKRKLIWASIYAMVFSLVPWTPPTFTPAVESAFQDAPESMRWAAPLALSIAGWADESLATLGTMPAYAGSIITFTLSKRDDGPTLKAGWPPGPDPVVPGDLFIYYIYITNTGVTTATVHLTDDLPAELTWDSFSVITAAGADWAGASMNGGATAYLFTMDAVISPTFKGLGPGKSAVLAVKTIAQSPLEQGYVFTNTRASYSAYAEQEPTYTCTGTNDVATTVAAPRLAVAKTAMPDPVEAGSAITFTTAVSNSGSFTLTAPFTLTVVDRVPNETNFVAYTLFPNGTAVESGGTVTWTLPFTSGGNADLIPGETLTATLVVTVDVPFTHTYRITNTTYSVSITPTDQITPTSTSGTEVPVEVSSHPSLTVTKRGLPNPVYASQDWTYWITVTNATGAQGNAIDLIITDTIPVSTVLRSVSPGAAGASVVSDGISAGSVVTWTFPGSYLLFWGDSTSVSFTVGSVSSIVVSGTVVTNTTYGVTASNALAPVAGGPVTTTLWGAPHLQAAKVADPLAITAANDTSDVITFTITVTNLGDATADATGVVITDTIPDYTELIAAGFSSGTGSVLSPSAAAGSVITWNVSGSLVPTSSVVVTFTVHVSTPVDDNTAIDNRAFAVCSEGDYTATNQVNVTVYSTPTLEIAKVASSEPISADGVSVLTYTIYYTNSGTMNAYDTVLTDTLPGEASLVNATPAPSATSPLTWGLGTVWGSGIVQVAVTVTYPITNGSIISNEASIRCQAAKYTETGAIPTTVKSWPIFELNKAEVGGSDPISAGTYLTYGIAITNTGYDWARDVVVTDVVPENTTLISTSLQSDVGGTSMYSSGIDAGNTITWAFGSYLLPVGESVRVTFTVLVHSWLTNSTYITNTTYGVTASNALAPVSGAAEDTRISSYPRLVAGKNVVPPSVMPGQVATYTITVANYGNDSSRNTLVTDSLPTGIAFGGMLQGPAPGSTSPEVWTSLYITGAITRVTGYTPTYVYLVFTATVTGGEGDYTNFVTVTDQYSRETTASETLYVYYPEPQVSKVANASTVDAGGTISYTITYTNNSSTPANGVLVTDTLPQYISGGGSDRAFSGTVDDGNVITWNLGTLGGNVTGTIVLTVTVDNPLTNTTMLVNRTGITCTEGFSWTAEPVTVTVASAPDLAITKSDENDPLQAGGVITYRIYYTSTAAGTDWARNVVVSDTLPDNIVGGLAVPAPDGGTIGAGATITWGFGTLAPNQSGAITLWLTTTASIIDGTVLTNSVSITCDEGVGDSTYATTTVSSNPNLVIAKVAQFDPVPAGEVISYTITYTNVGNGPATSLIVSDTLPANVVGGWASPSPDGGTISAGSTVTWGISTLAGGGTSGSISIYLTTTTPLDAPVAVTNDVTITAAEGVSATASATTNISCSPDLTVTKAVNQPTAVPGNVLTYTIAVTNAGNRNAAGPVVITDLLPVELTVVNVVTTAGSVASSVVGGQTMVTWTLSSLAGEGGSQQLGLGVQVTRPLTDGVIIANTAWLSYGASITPSSQVTFAVVSAPNIEIAKSGPNVAQPGDLIAYTIVVTNVGTELAYGVTVTDVVPQFTTFVAASDSGVSSTVGSDVVVTWTFDMPALDIGYTRVFTVQLDSPLDNGVKITNTAWVSDSGVYTESNPVVVTVVSTPTLYVVKSESGDPVNAGGLLTYTITYSNSGDMIATGVAVTDTVDANVTVLSTVPPSTSMAGQVIVWQLSAPLTPSARGQITIVVQVTDTLGDNSVITNVAEINCDQGVYTYTGDVTTTVRAANVAVSKQATPTAVRPGEWVTYTIVFSNVGGVEASVRITDSLPVSFTLVSSSTMGAVFDTQVGNSYAWLSSTVPVSSKGWITITAQVTTTGGWIDPAGTVVSNVVTSAAAGDTDPTNDVVQVPVTVTAGPAYTLTMTTVPTTTPVTSTATITVTVIDLYGNLVYDGDNYTVTLNSTPAGATLSSPLTIAGGQGTTTIASTVARTYDVTALVSSMPAISDTAQVTFTSGAVDHFIIAPIGDQTAGIGFTIDVTAVDQYSNTVNFVGPVQLEDTAPTNTLQPTTTGTFVGGVLSSQDVTITLARIDTPIRVFTGTVSSTSNSFTVTANVPNTITVGTSPTTVLLSTTALVTATVVDGWGNPVSSEPVTFTIGPGGLFSGLPDPNTDNSGVANAQVYSTTTPGVATIVVTASNSVTGSVPITFIAGCPTTVTVTIDPTSRQTAQSAVITVEVRDLWNNPVDWASVSLAATDLGSGVTIANTTPAVNASGQATTTISATIVGAKTVTATASAGTCPSVNGTAVVTFTPGAATYVTITVSPNPQVVGVDATLYATVTDQYGNPRAGDVITFGVTPGALGGGGINPITGTTDAQGVATTAISSTLATSTLVTATVASAPVVSDSEWVTFTVGAPQFVTVTVSPAAVEGGIDATLTVTVTDQYGNLSGGAPVTFTYGALGAGGVAPNPVSTTPGGVATALISGTIPGPVVVTATVSPSVVDTTTLTITAGLLDHLETSWVADQVAGITFTLIVTTVDALGNPRSENGTISLADTTGTNQPTTWPVVDGTATVVLSITQAMIDDQIFVTWSASVTGSTNLFTVTAGAPATVTLTATPNAISPGGATSILSAIVRDAYGNLVSGQAATFTVVSGPVPAVTVAPASGATDVDGQITSTLTSGTDQGTATIQVECGGVVRTVDVEIRTFFVYLPLVLRRYTGVDLRPVSGTLQVIPEGGGQYEIRVTIENVGPNTVTADFWVDLYIDPDPAVPIGVNVLWHQVCTYGKAWFVRQDLAPGQQLVLSTKDPDDPRNPGDPYSNWPGYFEPGTHTLQVLVDSYGDPGIGAVIEYNELNNPSETILAP